MEWIRLAREGDTEATRRFCEAVDPFINRLCHWQMAVDKLGADEVRSIAALATVEFLMTYSGPLEGRKIPLLLRRFVRCELVDTLRGQNSRQKYLQPEPCCNNSEEEEEYTSAHLQDTDPSADPEYRLMKEELTNEVHDAIRNLSPNEQAVIRSIYFMGKRIGDVSKQLHCSPQYARRLHRAAMQHLREQLEKRLA